MPFLRSVSAATLSRSVSSRSRSASIMLCLNTATVSAIWPTSSLRPTPGTSTVLSPPASARIATHMRTTGRAMPRPISQASTTPTASPASPRTNTSIVPLLVTASASCSVVVCAARLLVLRLVGIGHQRIAGLPPGAAHQHHLFGGSGLTARRKAAW